MTDTLAAALARGYRVERELGQVGIATVYLAWDFEPEYRPAVEVLRSDLGAWRDLRQGNALGEPAVVPNRELVVRAGMAAGR